VLNVTYLLQPRQYERFALLAQRRGLEHFVVRVPLQTDVGAHLTPLAEGLVKQQRLQYVPAQVSRLAGSWWHPTVSSIGKGWRRDTQLTCPMPVNEAQ
jgi:hypothetical protein